MKCQFCDYNVWRIEYRPDMNILSLHCQNCGVVNIDIDISALEIDWKINNPEE